MLYRAFFFVFCARPLHSQPHAKPPSQMRPPATRFFFLFVRLCPAKCARLRLATLSATRHTVFCVSFAFCGLNFAQILKNIFEILKFKIFEN